MSKQILIDVGSSTLKAYLGSAQQVRLIDQQTVFFKNGFGAETGISEAAQSTLDDFIARNRKEEPQTKIKIYATGIFRKMTPAVRTYFIDRFFMQTGLFFNIISQDLENFYLQMALMGKCTLDEPVLLINVGGGSTELAVMLREKILERKNIDLGVGTVIGKFPRINSAVSSVKPPVVISFVRQFLPDLSSDVKLAFYTGGELTYMKRAGYQLTENKLFTDQDHPSVISTTNFIKRNKEIFEKTTLKELENLMPENPKWMHGARPCSAIAQAVCEKFNIKTIIPSDSNIVHGAGRQEFRQVVLSGSFRKHLDYIVRIKTKLEKQGVAVLSPRFVTPKNLSEDFVVFEGEENLTPLELERYHLNSITEADALIVCNPKGYVGASSLIEVGFANMLGKRIIFTEKPTEFMLNTLPAEIGL